MPKEDTQFKKGQGGREPGVPNKLTKTIRESVLEAYNELQKDKKANIVAWGKRQPGLFYQIAARLIPTEINATLAGKLEITKPSWFDTEAAYHILPAQSIKEEISN
jgi:hypothetical protein